jgi:hypothetical protein
MFLLQRHRGGFVWFQSCNFASACTFLVSRANNRQFKATERGGGICVSGEVGSAKWGALTSVLALALLLGVGCGPRLVVIPGEGQGSAGWAAITSWQGPLKKKILADKDRLDHL